MLFISLKEEIKLKRHGFVVCVRVCAYVRVCVCACVCLCVRARMCERLNMCVPMFPLFNY